MLMRCSSRPVMLWRLVSSRKSFSTAEFLNHDSMPGPILLSLVQIVTACTSCPNPSMMSARSFGERHARRLDQYAPLQRWWGMIMVLPAVTSQRRSFGHDQRRKCRA